MAISRTTFRIVQRTLKGPEALEMAINAVREVLPNSLIDCVQLNRTKFEIDLARYPTPIWHQLLLRREWHDKLVYHLANSLACSDHGRRMVMQAEFASLITAADTRVTLYGTMLFESEGTPTMLGEAGIPMAESFGCELKVDAYTEYVKAAQRNHELIDSQAVQRAQYEKIQWAEPRAQASKIT